MLYQLIGSVLFINIAFFISRPKAVTDIYVQLKATKGILSQLDFTGVGHHPWGIASIASLLRLCGIDDPLILLYYIQPFLVAISFCLLFNLLRTELSNKFSFFISLSSLSSLVFIRSMNEVTAEIISLTTILLFIVYVWNNIITKHIITMKIVSFMVVLSWIAILCRHANLFIIIGILIFFYLNNIFSKLKLLLLGSIMLLPGLIRALFFYTQKSHFEMIFSINMPVEVIDQLTKHFLNFTEIILPYSLHLNHLPWIKLFIVSGCLLILLLLIKYQKDSGETEYNKRILLANYFFTIGCSYYCILSFAAVYYNYDWGELYRVSGYGIIFMLSAFWIYTSSFVKWSKYVLVILILSSMTKVSYGLRYEILSNQHRFLFQDYRQSVKEIIEYINTEDVTEDVYVYTDKSGYGRNLHHMLSYYDLIHSLPFDINVYSNSIKQSSIILCSDLDLDQFNASIYRINKIPGIEGVYAIKK